MAAPGPHAGRKDGKTEGRATGEAQARRSPGVRQGSSGQRRGHRPAQGIGRAEEAPSPTARNVRRQPGRREHTSRGQSQAVALLLCVLLETLAPSWTAPCPDFAAHPPYLVATADQWDASQTRFEDVSGNGRHGVLTAGIVSAGTISGNGAQIEVPYIGGGNTTVIEWPASSVPTSFTICSITRYTGSLNHQRVLQCDSDSVDNWLHGHHGGSPGATWYFNGGNEHVATPRVQCLLARRKSKQRPYFVFDSMLAQHQTAHPLRC